MTFYPRVTTTSIGAQPVDSDLTAIAALATTATGRSLLAAANAAAIRTIADAQQLDATLTNLATLGTAADKILYTTAADTFAEAAITAGARAFVAGTATAAQVAALGAESAWTYVVLGSDFSTTLATAQDTGLKFTPAVSKTYIVEACVGLRTGVAGIAPRPGVAWNTGNDDGWARLQWTDIGGSVNFTLGTTGTDFGLDPTGPIDATSTYLCEVQATVVAGSGAAGAFIVTLKSETAANSVSAKKGSWLRYKAIT